MKTYLSIWALWIAAYGAAAAEPWPVPADVAAPVTARTPDSGPGDPVAPWLIRTVPLEDVAFYAKGGGLPDTFVRFAPDSRRVAIGTFLGSVMVLDAYSGVTAWERHIPEGMIKTLDFSPDGDTLFYGEQSVDGLICAVDANSGIERWRFRLADDLEASAPPSKDDRYAVYHLPGAFRLRALDDGGLLALGVHAWGDHNRPDTLRRWSRVYRFDASGSVRWAFPAAGAAPMTFVFVDGDPAGRRVGVLAADTASNTPADFDMKSGSFYALDGATGTILGDYTFEPLEPYFSKVWMWRSLSVGIDGERAAVGLFDGRSFLFDMNSADPIRQFNFGVPVMMGAIPVSASATYAFVSPDGMAYFQTGNSNVPIGDMQKKVTALPGPHPNANTIHAVDSDGRVAWSYRSGHHYQGFWSSADGRWVLTSGEKEEDNTGRNAGAFLFDTARPGGGAQRFVYYFQVRGRSFFNADISPDGALIAVTEVPYVDPESQMLTGAYQVHLVR